MKRLFLQIFAWLAILLGVGLMLQPTVSRYLTEQKSTKTVQKFVQAAEAAAPDFLGQLVVSLRLGLRHGSLAVDVDQIQRITGIGSSRNGHVQVRGFAARGRFLQFEQQLVDGEFVTRTGQYSVGSRRDG